MAKTTLEEKKRHYRKIYEMVHESPWISSKDISERLGISLAVTRARMQEAFEYRYVEGPQITKKSFGNLREHMCFTQCELSLSLLHRIAQNPNTILYAMIAGLCDLVTLSREKLEIEGNIILDGYRSDYYTTYVPDRSWQDGVTIIRKKIDRFNPEDYEPKGYIETHFDETAEWDLRDELLFEYFAHDLRKPLQPLIKESGISRGVIKKFFKRLPHLCDISTTYFPDTQAACSADLFMLETDYEDFVIELFSELPACSVFFKVSDSLFCYVYPPRRYSRGVGKVDIKSHISFLVYEFKKRGIITEKDHSAVECIFSR